MKKFLVLVVLILIGVFAYYKYFYTKDNIYEVLDNTEEESFYVDNYSIFGQYLNINSCIDKILDGEVFLVLKNNKEEIKLNTNFINGEKTCFGVSINNKDGISLDDLKQGNYLMLVKQVMGEEEKYYNLINKTEYNDLTYYTITKDDQNNEISIKFDNYNDKGYLNISIKQKELPDDVYDITIDPGHGGKDPGTSFKLDDTVYNESEITLNISLKLKKHLEDLGLKVKITRDRDIDLDNYGDNGRSVIPNKTKSKYSISIHVNSLDGKMTYGGVEVYTPNDIDYTLSKLFADNISEIVGYSKKGIGKLYDGVYYTYFTKEDIKNAKEEMISKNYEPYEIVEGSPYMFMIREVGGLTTHAYVDGRNEVHGKNIYYNSNQTAEPYLIELGYINYEKDLENLTNREDAFAKAISNAIEEYLDI